MDPSFQEQKKQYEEKLSDILIASLEAGTITEDIAREVIDYSLEKMKQVNSHEDLSALSLDLSSRWPIFSAMNQNNSPKDEEKIGNEVASLAKSGNIEEAISLAKSATDN